MSFREHQFLQSEIATLEGLLSDLSDERVIERLGFQHRLQEARDRLQQVLRRQHARALPITFRGDPVEGSHSIDATFASEALKAFVEATDTVAASLMIDRMARPILQGGAGRDEDEMGSQIENWARAVHAATLMQHPGNARTQMLAMPDRRMEEMHRGRFGSSLAGDRLCARLRRV